VVEVDIPSILHETGTLIDIIPVLAQENAALNPERFNHRSRERGLTRTTATGNADDDCISCCH
jgi:hypothetical protein